MFGKSFRQSVASKVGKNFGLNFLRLSFLLTIGLWLWAMWSELNGPLDVLCGLFLSVLAAAMTYEFVAAFLIVCAVPFILLWRMIRGR